MAGTVRSSVHGLSFTAQVQQFVDEANQVNEEIFHEAVIDLFTDAQMIGPSTAYQGGQGGRNPVDTGWHRQHFEVSFSSMPTIDPNSNPPSNLQGWGLHYFHWDREATYATVRQAALGTTIFAGWTAAYALFLEFRTGQSSLFAQMSAQKWEIFVEKAAERVIAAHGLN